MPVALVSGNLESWYLPLPRLNYLTFYLAVFLQIMVLLYVQFRCRCTLLTSYLLLSLVNHYVVCIYSHFSCNSYCDEYQIYYRKDKMLVGCMFSQPYRSLIIYQNCCLDNSNPNSIIGSIAGVHKFNFSCFMKYWNSQSAMLGW